MKATFKVSFFIQKTKLKANGKAPILGRIWVKGNPFHQQKLRKELEEFAIENGQLVMR